MSCCPNISNMLEMYYRLIPALLPDSEDCPNAS